MLTTRILAGALVAGIAWVTFHPGGLAGDRLRGWVVILAALLLCLHAWRSRGASSEGSTLVAQLPLLAAASVMAVGFLQIVPLPRLLVALLAPETAALYGLDEAAAGSPEAWRPLSIEPLATARAVLLGTSYLIFFVVARSLGRQQKVAQRMALALGIVGALVSLYALVRVAESTATNPRPVEPFLNPNHLATFLTLSLGLALGVALAPSGARGRTLERALSRRGLAGLCVLLIVVGLVLTQSRGGLLAAGTCAAVCIVLSGAFSLHGLSTRRRRWRWAGLALGVLALALGLANADPDPTLARIEGQPVEVGLEGRVRTWSVALDVIGGRPLAGSGLATFDDASFAATEPGSFIGYRPESAHNDYLELAADVGVPVVLLVILGVASLVVHIIRGLALLGEDQRSVAAGALAGGIGALVHATGEFALQIPGAALLAATSLGLASGLTLPRSGSTTPRWVKHSRYALALGLAALGTLSLFLANREAGARPAYRLVRQASDDEMREDLAAAALRELAASHPPAAWTTSGFCQQLSDVACHLAEPDFALALREARHAVARAPGRAHTHMLLAYLLLDRGWAPLREAGQSDEAIQALRREGLARLELSLRLGPNHPILLLTAGRLELDAFITSGDPAHRDRAKGLLERALEGDARLRTTALQALESRRAQLGADAAPLREALEPRPKPTQPGS